MTASRDEVGKEEDYWRCAQHVRRGRRPVPDHVLESARRTLLRITRERWDYLADPAEETLKFVAEC